MLSFRAALILLAAILLADLAASPALAQTKDDEYVALDVALDMNGDGRIDRAVLSGGEGRIGNKDLAIYLDAGTGPIDPARKPSFFRKGLADGTVAFLEAKGKNKSSLAVQFGCGGCSNDYETILTIVYRGGEFLVAGYTLAWEARDHGAGQCDINFLTGRGTLTKGISGGNERAVKGRFAPVKLADWDQDKHAPLKACGF